MSTNVSSTCSTSGILLSFYAIDVSLIAASFKCTKGYWWTPVRVLILVSHLTNEQGGHPLPWCCSSYISSPHRNQRCHVCSTTAGAPLLKTSLLLGELVSQLPMHVCLVCQLKSLWAGDIGFYSPWVYASYTLDHTMELDNSDDFILGASLLHKFSFLDILMILAPFSWRISLVPA